jgi:hypothetical protein
MMPRETQTASFAGLDPAIAPLTKDGRPDWLDFTTTEGSLIRPGAGGLTRRRPKAAMFHPISGFAVMTSPEFKSHDNIYLINYPGWLSRREIGCFRFRSLN